MPRIVSTCALATIIIIVLYSSYSFFSAVPGRSSTNVILAPDLAGAVPQAPAKAPPPPHVVSEEWQAGRSPEDKKKAEKEKEEKKKKEEEKRKKEEKNKPIERENNIFSYDRGLPEWSTSEEDDRSPPEGPKPHEIVLLSASDGKGHNNGIPNLLERAEENRRQYADYMGYQYLFINITKYDIGNYHPVWAKLPALAEAFATYPKAKWIWWLDLDAIIMTPTIDLNAHLLNHTAILNSLTTNPDGILGRGGRITGIKQPKDIDPSRIDLLISQDHNGINAGSFFLRRSPWTQMLIDLWSDPFYRNDKWDFKEQSALSHMLVHHQFIRKRIAVVHMRKLNSYAVGFPSMGWQKGDLAVHFAGCWVENECADRFEDYWVKRTVVSGKKGTELKEEEKAAESDGGGEK